MSSNTTLEMVSSKIDLVNKSNKLFSLKNASGFEFRGLVTEKKENNKELAEQNVLPRQVHKNSENVEILGSTRVQQKLSNQFKNNAEPDKLIANSSEFDQAKDVVEEIVQGEQQQTLISQLLQPECLQSNIKELSIQEMIETEEASKYNILLENDFKPADDITFISLYDKPNQQLIESFIENTENLNDNRIKADIIGKSEDELIILEDNTQPVIPSIALSNISFDEYSSDETIGQAYPQDQINVDNSKLVNKIDNIKFEDDEVLLAKLSSQNFKNENKATQEQLKINPALTSENHQDKVEVAVKFDQETVEFAVNNSLSEVKLVKLAIDNNSNSMFADTSRAGQKILNDMRSDNKKNISEQMNNELVAKALSSDFLEEIDISLGFENNNSNSKFATEISNFGGIIQTNQDDKLIVSFKDKLVDKVDNTPHRTEQVSLSIKEAITSGKSNITINMYPKALGAIDIQIEFNMVGGKQVVENIKIVAERKDTLDIIQKSEAELRKNLTEVTKSSTDTSLEFNLKHNDGNNGKGGYFEDFEERQNWMDKFQQSTDKSTELNSIESYNDQNNCITENSVNIIA